MFIRSYQKVYDNTIEMNTLDNNNSIINFPANTNNSILFTFKH